MGRNDTLLTPDGPRVKARRQALGLSVERLATEAHVSAATVANVERSKRVTPLTIGKLDTALDKLEAARTAAPLNEVTLADILGALVADRQMLIGQLAEIQALVRSLLSERQSSPNDGPQSRGNPS